MIQNLKILIVEDNPGDAVLIGECLDAYNTVSYDTSYVENLSDALNILKKEDFDVILLDLNLPDSNGFETFEKINEVVSEIAIIVLTGLDDNIIGQEAVNKGAQDFVVKSKLNDCLINKSIYYSYQRKQNINKEKHLYRVLKAVRAVNQLIVTEDDKIELVEKVIKKLVDTNGYYFSWIYLFEEQRGFNYNINKDAGKYANIFFDSINSNNLPHCIAKANQTNQLVISSDIIKECEKCEFFDKENDKDFYLQTLKYKDKIYGYLGVGLDKKYSSDVEEQEMFNEVANDISFALNSIEQKQKNAQYQKEILESELHYESLLNNPVNYAIYRLREGGEPFNSIVTHVSPSLSDILGLPKEDLYNFQKWFLNIHPNDHPRIIEAILKVAQPPFEFDEIFRYNHPEKGLVWLQAQAKGLPFQNNPEKIEYSNGIITDVTELKEAEIKLLEQNQENESLLEEFKAQNEHLYDLNESTEKLLATNILQKETILRNNERLESLVKISSYQIQNTQELFDFALAEAIKLTDSEIGSIYKYEEIKKQFTHISFSEAVMENCIMSEIKKEISLEKSGLWGDVIYQNKHILVNNYDEYKNGKKGLPGGHTKLSRFLAIPVFIENEIVAVVGVANKESDYNQTDVLQLSLLMDNVWKITERQKLIENLELAKKQAEESDKLKTVFLANMSHEIRTPMNAILGFSVLLKKNNLEKPKQERYLEIIHKSSNQLLKIIDDIIDISKIDANQINITIEPCSPLELVKDVKSVFFHIKEYSENKNVELILDRITNETIFIESDPNRLKQVISNLISNAYRYTEYGKIIFGYTLNSDDIVFFVKDTGIGIPKEKQEVIFERFRQVDEFSYHEGTGLGLTISKALVELLGGKIWLESEPNKGTVFYFSIPLSKTGEKPKVVEKQQEEMDVLDLSGKNIFLAEDSDFAVAYLIELLAETHANVFVMNDGEELMFELKDFIPDLILLDINMPKKTGLECLQEIKQRKIKVKILAQTAYAMSNEKELLIEAGADEYISKPIDSTELFVKIKKLLEL
ncbi:MAG: response regulator [Bacteroidales bacterium]|nr:response regulator [Bacteroidales bacterium]